MNDVLEVLDDLEALTNDYTFGWYELDLLRNFIDQKRSEYEEPKGDCCG